MSVNPINSIISHHKIYVAFTRKKSNLVILILSVGVFVALFLNLFLPFGTSGAQTVDGETVSAFVRITYLSLFGLVWSFVLAAFEFLLKPLLKKYWDAEKSPATHLCWLVNELLIISFSTFLLRSFLSDWRALTLDNFVEMIYATLLLFLFPYFGFTLYYKNRVRYDSTSNEPLQGSPILLFSSDTGKGRIEVPQDRLLYISADDNYVKIFYLKENVLCSHLLRSSLKRVEETVNSTQLVRTHRSYLVNPDFVQSFAGNSSGLKLKLIHVKNNIPVAKGYVENVESLLKGRSELRNKTLL